MTAALAQTTPAYGPVRANGSRTLSRFHRAAAFVLAGIAGFILLWAPVHGAPTGATLRGTDARPVTTLSSEQLLSQLRSQQGLPASPPGGTLQPASFTVVPVPAAQR